MLKGFIGTVERKKLIYRKLSDMIPQMSYLCIRFCTVTYSMSPILLFFCKNLLGLVLLQKEVGRLLLVSLIKNTMNAVVTQNYKCVY